VALVNDLLVTLKLQHIVGEIGRKGWLFSKNLDFSHLRYIERLDWGYWFIGSERDPDCPSRGHTPQTLICDYILTN